jgi:hypothetical protein
LNPDSAGVGELVTRGRNVCMGYIWDEEKTRQYGYEVIKHLPLLIWIQLLFKDPDSCLFTGNHI